MATQQPSPEKEVIYSGKCSVCKHQTVPEDEEPCHECLNTPTNLWSHTPINYEHV